MIAINYQSIRSPDARPRSRWLAWLAILVLAPLAGHAGPVVGTETVMRGLEHPWSLAFLPDRTLLVTERAGRLRALPAGSRRVVTVAGTPAVVTGGQAGLFDVVVDPDYARNGLLYLSWVEAGEDGRNGLAVTRARLDTGTWRLRDTQVIFRQSPKADTHGHYGGRLVFARDGTLFVTLGDRQADAERAKAQHIDKHHGKIVRIHGDGRVPADNPFIRNARAQPEIFSLGHRNPQGAALHPVTGELWASEHGPQGGDEINVVRAGRNYGWPVISHGCEYGTCRKIGEGSAKAGMEQPVTWWPKPSTAPSGLAFYTGDRYPGWQGNLFSGALAGRGLWRITLDGERVVAREKLLHELGERIRDARQGPDGFLYLATDSPTGHVLRVVLHQ